MPITKKGAPRLVALYLPQYHPIPENNEWWGAGFTEWTNTAKAKPLFKGHYQPHVPADLGFYDLRLAESRLAQANMAQDYGIEAFCYYHYWFAGKQILEKPFNEVLASGQPDFPFCLCWANTNWTGIWHGAPDRMLIEQTYPGIDDHKRHFDYLLHAFKDRRYLCVDGKPVFIILTPQELPESLDVTKLWRKWATEAGLPGLFLLAFHKSSNWDPKQAGFDAVIQTALPPRRRSTKEGSFLRRCLTQLKNISQDLFRQPTVYEYKDAVNTLIKAPTPGIESHPCIIPNWDNTPRCGSNGLVLHNSDPELFRQHLRKALQRVASKPDERKIIFIKSWNEWGEGNHLEPDLRFGKRYLEVLQEECSS